MQIPRLPGVLLCTLAFVILGCTESNSANVATTDAKTEDSKKSLEPQSKPASEKPASAVKQAERKQPSVAIVARAKDNETKPLPEVPQAPKTPSIPDADPFESGPVLAPKSNELASAANLPKAAPELKNEDAKKDDAKSEPEAKPARELPREQDILAEGPKAGTPKADDLKGVGDAKPPQEKPLSEAATGLGNGDVFNAKTVEPEIPNVPELHVGDAAPLLKNKSWLKGEAVEAFAPGQVYVVEFWATWCGPCVQSIPHLGEMQTAFGNKVRFIGVSIDDDEATPRQFMDQQATPGKTFRDLMTYTVAFDKDGQSKFEYVFAARGNIGIPTAFLVGKDGKVEWIGHAMEIEEPLKQVLDGKWDRAKFAEAYKLQREMDRILEEVNMVLQSKGPEPALEIIEKHLTAMPDSFPLLNIKMQLLGFAKKHEELSELRAAMVKSSWEDPSALFQIAWGIAMKDDTQRDYELAIKAAIRADELEKGKNPDNQVAIAKLYHDQGNLQEGVNWIKKAYATSGNHENLKKLVDAFEQELKENGAKAGPGLPPAPEKDEKASSGEKKSAPADSKKPAPAEPAKK